MKNPYEILGVSSTASQDAIKSAYRKLAKKLHPDLNPGKKDIENKFKDVTWAYEMIGTPEARGKWDRGETQEHAQEFYQQQAARGAAGGFGTRRGAGRAGQGPFFYETQENPGARYSFSFGNGEAEDLFSNIFGGMGRGDANDETYEMEIDFKDSILGAEKEIQLPENRRLTLKTPPGIKPGARLRLAGKGVNGGDVYIKINVKPSNQFKRVGNDLEVEFPISLAESVLGGEVKAPTIDGNIMLKVPKGANAGTKLRVRGKGVPIANDGRGDQIVILKVVMPPKVDEDLEKAIRDWSAKHSYNPRTGL